jgi:hypothetical protein
MEPQNRKIVYIPAPGANASMALAKYLFELVFGGIHLAAAIRELPS